jgi:hypothetical protein
VRAGQAALAAHDDLPGAAELRELATAAAGGSRQASDLARAEAARAADCAEADRLQALWTGRQWDKLLRLLQVRGGEGRGGERGEGGGCREKSVC